MARTILVVCGLKVEARLAKGRGVRTCIGGGRSDTLAAAIDREVAHGVDAIVSFGLCGALVPSLAPGTLIVATSTVFAGRSLGVEARWSELLARRLPDSIRASLAGSEKIVSADADSAGCTTRPAPLPSTWNRTWQRWPRGVTGFRSWRCGRSQIRSIDRCRRPRQSRCARTAASITSRSFGRS